MEDIQDKIFDIVARETRIDRASLNAETEVSQIESLDLVQIIFAIEDEFDIYVPQEDESFKLETLRDVIDGVRMLIEEKAAEATGSA